MLIPLLLILGLGAYVLATRQPSPSSPTAPTPSPAPTGPAGSVFVDSTNYQIVVTLLQSGQLSGITSLGSAHTTNPQSVPQPNLQASYALVVQVMGGGLIQNVSSSNLAVFSNMAVNTSSANLGPAAFPGQSTLGISWTDAHGGQNLTTLTISAS